VRWAIVGLTAVLTVLAAACSQDPPPVTRPLAILGAIPVELTPLHEALQERAEVRDLGVKGVTGLLHGRRVVVIETGIGKVNAAFAAGAGLTRYRPAAVLFCGTAGGLNPERQPGDVVLGARTVQHDLGDVLPTGMVRMGVRNPLTGQRNPTAFPADPALLAAARLAAAAVKLESPLPGHEARLVEGVIASGDVFVASPEKKAELRKALEAEAVEMEGAAVAQVCHQQNLPCLVIRAISDRADGGAEGDFARFSPAAGRNAAAVTRALVARLAAAR
jgi:adenosylhomocysteine nucleosidase